MKTFYIALEQQGYTRCLFKVKANSEQEANEKVKEALFDVYEALSVSKKDANEIMKDDGVDLQEIEEY